MREHAAVDGMTEPVIFRETAKLHGIISDRPCLKPSPAYPSSSASSAATNSRDRVQALPGVSRLLVAVAALDEAEQTVVTGNIRGAAETKLSVFGLDTHIRFAIGGYSEDDEERAELVRVAIRRASHSLKTPLTRQDVLLVGDTPADVAAAKDNHVPMLAVATGRSTVTELRQAGADQVASDLDGPSPVMRALVGS